MTIRQWFRTRMLGAEAEGDDVPPSSSLLSTLLGRDPERVRTLGEYSAATYPAELGDLLRRRGEVAQELLSIDITSPESRIAAIPRLQELLRRYPHPLAYETLIHAYVDAGRYDEARGVAFAARERRAECERSPYPEVRAEIERLKEWSPEDVDDIRADLEGGARERGAGSPQE